MNYLGFPRGIPKRRRTAKASHLLDLNLPPFEGPGEGGSPVSHETSGAVVAMTPQVLVPPSAAASHIGMNSFPIDVEAIEDDVVIYSSRSSLSQSRRLSTRTAPITVIIDDDPETTTGPAGEALDEHVNTLLSLGMNRRHDGSGASNSILPAVMMVPPVLVKEVPKEPKFTCPVCMDELVNPSSTICGHIFCDKCIRASIQARKKCPTCRRKLTINNFHRVYLPTTE